MKNLDLRFFGESAYGQNAESSRDEIQTHRQFLHALGEPDVEPGETLVNWHVEHLMRCWTRKELESSNPAKMLWVPMFNPRTQKFDGWYGYEVCGALRPGYFDEHWQPPKDCTGDEAIEDLPTLLPIKRQKPGHRILRHELEMRDL